MKFDMNRLILLLLLAQISNSQGYWQQHVEYKMDIKVNVNDFTYTGEQELIYTNNSPDTIKKVYYHLFFNAFKPNSQMDIRSRTIKDPDSRVGSRIIALEEKDFGDLSVKSLKQDGQDLIYDVNETILLAKLHKAIIAWKKNKTIHEF